MPGNRHVLLIDHDAKARTATTRILVEAGYVVGLAPDMQTGTARANEDFDLVLVNYPGDLSEMPAVRALLQLRGRRQLPVLVLVSSHDSRRLRNRLLAPGVKAISRLGCLEEIHHLERLASALGDANRKHSAAEIESAQRQAIPPRMTVDPDTRPAARSSREETWSSDTLARLRPDEILRPGSVVDKYRIEALVGTGVSAHVYRVTHLVLSMTCAVKVLKRSLAASRPDVVANFCAEARNAIRISHPNVVRVHDVTRSPAHTFLVMEWVEGVTLADILSTTGRLPANDLLRIAIAVCAGLEAALSLGMTHRDIKPANILLGNDGSVKLVDFGLATDLASGPAPAQKQSTALVMTPTYLSPEHAFAPETGDSRSDIYSLGATLFHACAGIPPFQAVDPLRILAERRGETAPDLAQSSNDCPAELCDLIMRMLSIDSDQRPASLSDLRTRFERILVDLHADGSDVTNGWSNVYLRKSTTAADTRA